MEQIENINTKSVKEESSEKANQSQNSLPVERAKNISADENILLPDGYPVRNVENEENEDALELQSVEISSNPEKVLPLYTAENVFVKVFMVHASLKSALALAPFAQGFQKQVKACCFKMYKQDEQFKFLNKDIATLRTLLKVAELPSLNIVPTNVA